MDMYPQRAGEVLDVIKSGDLNWQLFVHVASNHLVLQTLYLNFARNGLLHYLPQDLCSHLKYIHELNCERNKIIIDHAVSINDLFCMEGITPIFMKGTGNIMDGLYSCHGERIMSDMDILIPDERMEDAAEILFGRGYRCNEKYDPQYRLSMMHYPPLWKEGLPAPVELHRLPVSLGYVDRFGCDAVNGDKKASNLNGNCYVMSDRHKIIHNFIHSHFMHWAFLHSMFFLRDFHDLMLLSGRENAQKVLAGSGYSSRRVAGYLKVVAKVGGLEPVSHRKFKRKWGFFSYRHDKALKWPYLSTVMFLLIRGVKLYFTLPLKAVWDKRYRAFVARRLKNPGWYIRHIKGYKEKLFSRPLKSCRKAEID